MVRDPKLTSTLSTFRLGVGAKIVPGPLFGVSSQFTNATQDVRSIVFAAKVAIAPIWPCSSPLRWR